MRGSSPPAPTRNLLDAPTEWGEPAERRPRLRCRGGVEWLVHSHSSSSRLVPTLSRRARSSGKRDAVSIESTIFRYPAAEATALFGEGTPQEGDELTR
jgi:hypothetical protein